MRMDEDEDELRWWWGGLAQWSFVCDGVWLIKMGVVCLCRPKGRAISQGFSLKRYVSIITTGSVTLPEHTAVCMYSMCVGDCVCVFVYNASVCTCVFVEVWLRALLPARVFGSDRNRWLAIPLLRFKAFFEQSHETNPEDSVFLQFSGYTVSVAEM